MPAADRPPPPESLADSHHGAATRPLLKELQRLRARADQREHSLAIMADAISVLRSNSQALREENLELQTTRRCRRRAGSERLAQPPGTGGDPDHST